MQRWVPFLYVAAAHLALGGAAAVTLYDPGSIAGFFYHPKMIGVVHTLTLGWISSSLIALLYLQHARLGLPVSRLDVAIFAGWTLGASGLASHFWIEEFNGMTWSAGLLGLAVLAAAVRFVSALSTCRLPPGLRLQIQLAWLNLVGAAFVGTLLGINKTTTVLPGYSLGNVAAHAHLAAIGWAFPLLVAVGHVFLLERAERLPAPWLNLAGALVTQLGAAGIFVSLLTGEPYEIAFGLVAGLGMGLGAVALGRHARAAGAGWNPGGLLVAVGSAWLVFAAAWYLAAPRDASGAAAPEAVMVYGVAGLLGGLAQAVAGHALAWLGGGPRWPAVAGWLVGVPLLVFGLDRTHALSIRLGAAALLLAVLSRAGSIRPGVVVRPHRPEAPTGSPPG